MTFQFKVFYEDDSVFSYGQKRSKMVRAHSRDNALSKFRTMYGIEPLYAV